MSDATLTARRSRSSALCGASSTKKWIKASERRGDGPTSFFSQSYAEEATRGVWVRGGGGGYVTTAGPDPSQSVQSVRVCTLHTESPSLARMGPGSTDAILRQTSGENKGEGTTHGEREWEKERKSRGRKTAWAWARARVNAW